MTLSSAELRPGSRHWAYTSRSPSDNLERRIEALVSKAPIFYQGLWYNTKGLARHQDFDNSWTPQTTSLRSGRKAFEVILPPRPGRLFLTQ